MSAALSKDTANNGEVDKHSTEMIIMIWIILFLIKSPPCTINIVLNQ